MEQRPQQDVTTLAFDWLKKIDAQLNAIRSMQAWLLLAGLVTAVSTAFQAYVLLQVIRAMSQFSSLMSGLGS